MKKAKLVLEIEFDEKATDADSVASALDRLMETAMSSEGILDEYNNPNVGEFSVLPSPTKLRKYTCKACKTSFSARRGAKKAYTDHMWYVHGEKIK